MIRTIAGARQRSPLEQAAIQAIQSAALAWLVAPLAAATLAQPALPADAVTETLITVTVTNSTDIVDGDTSSIPALQANPGLDGISFREAVAAANGTTGPKAVVFAPELKGATITIQPGPHVLLLSSGQLTIEGDIDQDGQPDVTLDGHLGVPGYPSALGLAITSSDNTIHGMRLLEFAGGGAFVACADLVEPNRRFVNIQIVDCVITNSRGRGISVSAAGLRPGSESPTWSDMLFQDIQIRGNTISTRESAIFLTSALGGSKRNLMEHVVISRNRITTSADIAVVIAVTDENSGSSDVPGAAVQYSDNNVIRDVVISENHIEGPSSWAINLSCGGLGNSNNRLLDVEVRDNTITGSTVGIQINPAGGNWRERGSSDNTVRNVKVRGNMIDHAAASGITVVPGSAGPPGEAGVQRNRVEDVAITGNSITNFSNSGITLYGGTSDGSEASQNAISGLTIGDNELLNTTAGGNANFGIAIWGGIDVPSMYGLLAGLALDNAIVDLHIVDNRISGVNTALLVYGGDGPGARTNQVRIDQYHGNELGSFGIEKEIVGNANGASGNTVTIFSPRMRRHLCSAGTGSR